MAVRTLWDKGFTKGFSPLKWNDMTMQPQDQKVMNPCIKSLLSLAQISIMLHLLQQILLGGERTFSLLYILVSSGWKTLPQ